MKKELFYLIMIVVSIIFFILVNKKIVVSGMQIKSNIVSRSSKMQLGDNTIVLHNNGVLYVYSVVGTLQNKIDTGVNGTFIFFPPYVYINNYSQNSILKINIVTSEKTDIPIPISPFNSCFDGDNLFVVFPYGNSIIYDCFQNVVTQNVPIKNLNNCLYDGQLFWYSNAYNLLGNTDNMSQTFSTPAQPISLDSDGDNLFVLCTGNLSKYTPSQNLDTIQLQSDTYVDLSIDKDYVYVLSVGKIYVFDKIQFTLEKTINVEQGVSIRNDNNNIYILSDNSIYTISKATNSISSMSIN